MSNLMRRALVTPVIELGSETILTDADVRARQIATDIRRRSRELKYTGTPDGWFVPLGDLFWRLSAVAEFIHLETIYYSEFEIYGGFNIAVEDGEPIGISTSSDFRSAMTLAEVIRNLRSNNSVQHVLVGAQEIWQISSNQSQILIDVKQVSEESKQFLFPFAEIKESLYQAQMEVKSFVAELEPLLLQYNNPFITSQSIRWQFGLDKISDRFPAIE